VTAYSIVDIPGWEQLRLGPDDAAGLRRRIDELAHQSVPEDVPRDRATPFRGEVRRHLLRLVDEAREAGAALICLPTTRMGGIAVPASYTVTEWVDPQPNGAPPEDVIAALVEQSDGVASTVTVDGQPAIREEGVESPAPDADELVVRSARRVTYTIADPADAHVWVLITFSTLGDGDPDGQLAHVLVELFDAHVGTLRWR
jgi:hypothetical protein